MSFRLSPQQELLWSISPDGPTDAGQLIVGFEGPSTSTVCARRSRASSSGTRSCARRFVRQPGMKTPAAGRSRRLRARLGARRPQRVSSPRRSRRATVAVAAAERAGAVGITRTARCSRRACLALRARSSHVLVLTRRCAVRGRRRRSRRSCASSPRTTPVAPVAERAAAVRRLRRVAEPACCPPTTRRRRRAGSSGRRRGAAALRCVPFMRRVAPAATETVDVRCR